MSGKLDCFGEIWLADFEFSALSGEVPTVVCLVAREFRTGRTLRLWRDELGGRAVPNRADSLFVAYYASAELGCHLSLGWPMPARVLDLFTEFRCITNGLPIPCGAGLLEALTHYGLDGIDAMEKESMRELAMRGGGYSDADARALLDYCQTDVDCARQAVARHAPHDRLAAGVAPRALHGGGGGY